MDFRISPAVFEKFPALQVGLLVVRGARNTGVHPDLVTLLREAEHEVRGALSDETFKENQRIAVWQEAHRLFGSNPNKFQPSHQALIKRVLKGGELPDINPLVDCYNIVSLRHRMPAGGEDIDRCQEAVRLEFADGTEPFLALGETEQDPPVAGEVIYKDDAGTICRRFNWREADRTKLTDATTHAVLVVESLVGPDALQAALADLAELVTRFVSTDVSRAVLTVDAPTAML